MRPRDGHEIRAELRVLDDGQSGGSLIQPALERLRDLAASAAARPGPFEPLDVAVWSEVCRLLADPARVVEEYQHRLQAVRTRPRRPELETLKRKLTKLRSGMGRLIDSHAEGVISKVEFKPRLAGMRQRVAKLEAEATVLQDAAEHEHFLQLVQPCSLPQEATDRRCGPLQGWLGLLNPG